MVLEMKILKKRNLTLVFLSAIIIIAAGLRFTGINWDNNSHVHPDERFLSMVVSGLEWPEFSKYFSFNSTINPYIKNPFFVYGMWPLYLTKAVGDMINYRGYDDYTKLGRILSGLFDVLTVLALFLVARELFDEKTALLSAFFLSITVIHIQHSHFFVVDLFSSFFTVLAFYFLLLFVRTERMIFAIMLGVSFGLAVAAKVSAAFLAIVIGVGCILVFIKKMPTKRTRRKMNIQSILKLAGMTFLIAILIASAAFITFRISHPYAFQGPHIWNIKLSEPFVKSFQDLKSQYTPESRFPPSYYWRNRSPFFQFKNLTLWEIGIPLSIICWLGLLWSAYQIIHKKNFKLFLPIAWVILMLAIMSFQFVKNSRYLLPAIPFIVMFGAYFFSQFVEGKIVFPKVKMKKIRIVIAIILILGCLVWPLAFAHIYVNSHPFIRATEWLYEATPINSTLANEHWDNGLPPYPPADRFRMESLNLYDYEPYGTLDRLPQQLSKIDYIIITSSRLYAPIMRLPDVYPLTKRYYELLFEGKLGYTLEMTFTNYPALFGIEIKDDNAYESFTVYDHPKVLIFKNVDRLTPEEISERLGIPKQNVGD